jgi:hypothetical protein
MHIRQKQKGLHLSMGRCLEKREVRKKKKERKKEEKKASEKRTTKTFCVETMGVCQGVAMDSLKYH